jgi:homoserine kinase
LIKYACEDALHQPYRSKLIPGYDEIVQRSKDLDCLGVFLSGAGPTIMAIIKSTDKSFIYNLQRFLDTLNDKWVVKELNIDHQGTVVSKAYK